MRRAATCTAGQFANLHRPANRLKQGKGPLRIMDRGSFEESKKCQPAVKFRESPSEPAF
jgi:hypothetical protein